MNSITTYKPSKLSFGSGCINQMVDDYIAQGFKRIFIFTAQPVLNILSPQVNRLKEAGIEIKIDVSIVSEPTFSEFENLLKTVRAFSPDSIAGIGGGSVMDLAKIVAAFVHNMQSLHDVVGIGLLKERKTHLVCAPSTSGTGSEVSPNSILLDDINGGKKGIISPFLVPDATYVDPDLTLGLPPHVTAFTGIDAFSHCLEAYANKNAHPFIDTYAIKGINLVYNNLHAAYTNGADIEARSNVSMGSMFGGFCLGPVNTAAVHALAYPLGSEYKMAHGLSIAILLPYIIEFNISAAPNRYANIARAIGVNISGTETEIAQEGLLKIKKLLSDCKIPKTLSEAGVKESEIEKLAHSGMQVQRLLKNNLRDITLKDAIQIYSNAF